MKAYVNTCPLCEENKPEIVFPVKYKGKVYALENIVICTKCGVVYKYPTIPEYEILHYMEPNHWKDSYFNKKLKVTADYIYGKVPSVPDLSVVMDVGAAAGHFLSHMYSLYNNAQCLGIEPSVNACLEAKNLNRALIMVPSTIEECTFKRDSIFLITALGVDYLFLDHVQALSKLAEILHPDGYFYLERNVFLDSKAYVHTAIRTAKDLFGVNTMMKNWFTEKQMDVQMSKFFDIQDKNVYISNHVDGNPNRHVGWLCRKKKAKTSLSIVNAYSENIQYIRNLPKE